MSYSILFDSPLPYGQHSTSYRSFETINNGNNKSNSNDNNATNMQSPTGHNGHLFTSQISKITQIFPCEIRQSNDVGKQSLLDANLRKFQHEFRRNNKLKFKESNLNDELRTMNEIARSVQIIPIHFINIEENHKFSPKIFDIRNSRFIESNDKKRRINQSLIPSNIIRSRNDKVLSEHRGDNNNSSEEIRNYIPVRKEKSFLNPKMFNPSNIHFNGAIADKNDIFSNPCMNYFNNNYNDNSINNNNINNNGNYHKLCINGFGNKGEIRVIPFKFPNFNENISENKKNVISKLGTENLLPVNNAHSFPLLKSNENWKFIDSSKNYQKLVEMKKPRKRVAFQFDSSGVHGESHPNNLLFVQKEKYSANFSKASTANDGGIPIAVSEHDKIILQPLHKFLFLSENLDRDIKIVSKMMATAVDIERNFIWIAAGKEEPTAEEKQQMLSPMFDLIKEVSQMAESKRKETTSNHISAVSDGIQIFGWLIMKPAVISYVNDMIDAATFFANRVMSDYKVDNKNPHSNWAKALLEVLNAIKSYVSQYHSKGLIWNTDPGASPQKSVSSVAAPSGLSQSPVASAVLPPPPPPPPPLPGLKCGTDNANVDRAALFAEINTGENITRRLKKVTADMQTHKNPALRAHIDETKFPKINEILRPSSVANKIDVEKTTKAKTFLENGKQWNIEYHKNNQNIVVEINDMKQTVYVFKCENSIIQIKGKLNSITLDGCKKVAIVFDSLLSQVEVINCQRMKIETRGAMPTLSIQKTDGCQVFLSKEAMSNAEIITSKSSEMNILVPIGADGDFVEFPVPEQFKTVFDGTKLQTTVSDIV